MMEGPGADSEEKHEPVSDIDTAVVVVGLKALDPEWPIREADIKRSAAHVRYVPCVDGSELARVFFTFAGWSVQPCVRPVSAAHTPLAIMPSADQVPVKSPHSRCSGTSGLS